MNQDQIRRHQNKCNIGIGLSMVLAILPSIFGGKSYSGGVEWILVLAVCFLFIWGCSHYAMSKGRHWAWGFLGFLHLLGLIILALMPRKTAEPQQATVNLTRTSPPPPPPQNPMAKFYLHLSNEVKGPFTTEQIRALLQCGTASMETQCCKEGSEEWRAMRHFL